MTDFATLRQRMVDNQLRTREVTDRDVIRAFLAVPREKFVTPSEQPFAYADRELRMADEAPGRRMLDPVTLARLVHTLPRGPETKLLVVGAGSGYSTAVLAHLVPSVTALEEAGVLAALARENLASLRINNSAVVEGKLTAGRAAGAPYDGILVDGAVEVLPDFLVGQLSQGGLLVTIERDDRVSRAMLYERIGHDVTRWPLFDAWATLLPGFERKREFVF